MKKKILIIPYYWPPSGGAGVQRWLKFIKYLPDFDWEPIVVVPTNANYPSVDTSLENEIPAGIEIIRLKIWEPYDIYRKFLGLKGDVKISHTFSHGRSQSSWKSKLSLWLKCNFFIPDPRVFWIFNTVPILNQYIKKNSIKYIVTTSPPNSIHLIGLFLKKLNKEITWITDFRDPWTNIYFEKDLPYNLISRKINRFLETKVIKNTDLVITVSDALVSSLSENHKEKNKFHCVTNGYDHTDFQFNPIFNYAKFTMGYVGTLYNLYNMPKLWEALSELILENLELRNHIEIHIAGTVSEDILKSFEVLGLIKYIKYYGYLNHNQIQEVYFKTNILLLTTPESNNQGILTGKVFEYLASLKPIICITSLNNNLWNLIQSTKSGSCIDFNDKKKMKDEILNLYGDFQLGKLRLNEKRYIEQYSRRALTEKLSNLIKSRSCAE